MCPKNGGQYSLGYSRDIRGVFVGYSWDIRMYRVCVGYVSGMYRECVEISEGQKRYQDCATARETTIQLQGYCKDNLDNFGDNDSQQWRQ